MSSSNLVALRYVAEATYNTTPADSVNWQELRFTSESISATPQVNQSNEVRSDRMVADQFLVTTEVGGALNYEFSASSYDDFLEAVLAGTWTGEVLKVSTDQYSFSVEGEFTDLTTNEFKQFTGMRVATMSMNVAPAAPISGEFTFAGAGAAVTDTSLVGGGSSANALTTDVMNSVGDVSNIKIDTVTFDGCINNIVLNIDNNLRPANCIGSDTPSDQVYGTALVTGTIEAYLSDATMLWYKNNVLGQVAMEIEFTVADTAGNTYVFLIPNAKISGEAPASGGLNTDVLLSAEFTALYDATEGTSLKITRTIV